LVWETTREHVAIKMMQWTKIHRMRGRQLEDPVKEIACMQLIGSENPHVMGIIESLQDDEFLYSVMPFCSGGDLFGVVITYAESGDGTDAAMPEPVARYWFRQILLGLHFLQTRGICHRDLSLENILVDRENTSLIIDMGMCLRVPYNCPINQNSVPDVSGGAMRRLMTLQGTCGKLNYMSPEVFRNNTPFDGFAIDLWAAGVILYIMLTGFPPYDQPSNTDKRFLIILEGGLHQQLREWGVHITHEAAHLLQLMLRVNPRHRLTLAQVMEHTWVIDDNVQQPPRQAPEAWER